MEKLREMVMKVATADQKKTLWPSQIAQIEQHLQKAFTSSLQTPNHPPYAAMIYKAITELNEEGGSTEESISQFIEAKYKDLPFAHKSFLSQHLNKLCDKGFVVSTAGKRHMIHNFTAEPASKITRSIKRKRVINRANSSPKEYEASNDNSSENGKSKKNNGRKRSKAKHQLVCEEVDEHELCNALNVKLSLTREIRTFDNKGKGRTKSRQPTTKAKKKLMLNELGESSKGLVKGKKKDMIKWASTAFSDLPVEEKLQEQLMGINKKKQIIDREERNDPSCLQSLVQTRFFEDCKIHSDVDSNKCNSYCLDCLNGALCNLCRTAHKDHNLIRITRSMWENVVVASPIQMYIEISGIQTHNISSRVYLSLKRMVSSRHRKHFTGTCFTCKRYLPDSFKFCSLYCKLKHDVASQALATTDVSSKSSILELINQCS